MKVAIITPLSAALVLKVTFIESLPTASHPFLKPLAESALHEFACHFYAEEKVNETKSNPNCVSKSVKKLEIVLQAMPEVQESQGLKALRNDFSLNLEKNPIDDHSGICPQGERPEPRSQEDKIQHCHLQMDLRPRPSIHRAAKYLQLQRRHHSAGPNSRQPRRHTSFARDPPQQVFSCLQSDTQAAENFHSNHQLQFPRRTRLIQRHPSSRRRSSSPRGCR